MDAYLLLYYDRLSIQFDTRIDLLLLRKIAAPIWTNDTYCNKNSNRIRSRIVSKGWWEFTLRLDAFGIKMKEFVDENLYFSQWQ
ncbi:hypothetical protein ACFL27_27160 [candidate division CSSED10-310 bacterium]|uniref:Uncharacterized protein n=1 Tax=candidate division CSSED10-310 bacterium TaxID=2855610 RepID=A0ABV6Z612_UNCC1